VPQTILAGLQTLLGPDRFVTDPETVARRCLDTWPLRLVQKVVGAEPEPPLCVVRPATTAEVARTLTYLYGEGVPVIPYGGGSGVVGGIQPTRDSVVLDLGALDQMISLNEADLTVTAQAGVFLNHLEAWLNERGYICGHYPQSIDVAQLGGLVATRSAGQFSTRYGNIEDLLVGLEAVLPDGQILRIHDLPRRAVGPDLRHLLMGSEGAFGIITEVTLKVFPRPVERWMHAYAIADMRSGLRAIQAFMREGWRPAVVRLHDAVEAERSYGSVVGAGECILLLLSEGPAGLVQAESTALHGAITAQGGRPLGAAPVEAWLHHRNDVHLFEQLITMGIIVDTIEVAAGWSSIANIYEQVTEAVRKTVPELLVISGHSSHSYPQGTNLYFIWAAQPSRDPAEVERVYNAVWQPVMESTLALGGTISHHHGVGRVRLPWVERELGSGYRLLSGIKQMLDPRGLMNPGTLVQRP